MIAAGSGGIGPGSGTVTANVYSGAKFAPIRWDGTVNDPTLAWYTSAGFGNYFPASANFNFRKPVAKQYGEGLGVTPAWANGAIAGAGVDTQRIIDDELAYDTGKIDGWMFDLYPPAEMLDPGDETQTSIIMLGWDAYFNSPIKSASGVKFAPLLQWSWYNYKSGKYIAAWNSYLATKMADTDVFKVGTKKLVVLYNDGGASGWQGHLTEFNTMCTALGGRGTLFVVGVTSVGLCTTLSLNAKMTYGPNGTQPSGTGEGPFSLIVTTNTPTWGTLPGEQSVGNMCLVLDQRPFNTAPKYIDHPTRPQAVTHTTNAKNAAGVQYCPHYARSEICEGGNPWDAGVVDAISFTRGGFKPQTYTYETSCHSAETSTGQVAVILTGAGWTYHLGIQGAYHNEEMWTSTAADTVTLNAHPNLRAFNFYGSTGAGFGTATVKVDGVVVGTINFAGATAVHQLLFSYTIPGPLTAHTVDVVCDGTGQIRCNSFEPAYKP